MIFLLLLNFLQGMETDAQTTTYYKAESFLFSFRQDNDLFLADYGDNAYQLERMGGLLDVSRDQILKGDCHLLIVSHVNAYEYEDEEVVNEASLRAGRIRAYLKTRFDIPHDCVAFYIDRSGNYRDQVHVYKVHKPLPWFANIAIHYSESRYPSAIKAAISRYGVVPYVDLYRRGVTGHNDHEVYRIDDPLFDPSELEDYRLASVVDTLQQYEVADVSAVLLVTTETTKETVPVKNEHNLAARQEVKVIPAIVEKTERRAAYLAVKTNLLPWCTLVPSVRLGTGQTEIETGSFMPNLEIEWYFAGRWSVVASGMYADFSYEDKIRDRWSVSEFSVEPRVWPLRSGCFAGLNTGLFGEYGDFDVCGSEIDPDSEVLYGRTGRFWTLGASIGCLIPLGKGFCCEVSMRTGYRSVFDGKKYRYDKIDDKNYLETRFSSTGFMIGLKVSLVYRFQIR
ncbi:MULTISPECIES: DUF3575 domain-containing protein [Parabacteroides]|uniref:DUF3575 domain-containing protein n=1 Tax=Parabacteroides TaxID=375288 RepID=UPI001F40B9A2|nr:MULTISPECIES: DUF3575 domain-containing protein [Parabacteroides]